MGLVSWMVVGVIAGLLAGRIVAEPGPSSFVLTVLLGMAGASVGGFIVGILGGSGATGFNVWSVFGDAGRRRLALPLRSDRPAGGLVHRWPDERSIMALQSADRVRVRGAQFGEPGSYAGYEVRDPLGQRIGVAEEVLAD